jgi:hypothetical protein
MGSQSSQSHPGLVESNAKQSAVFTCVSELERHVLAQVEVIFELFPRHGIGVQAADVLEPRRFRCSSGELDRKRDLTLMTPSKTVLS